MNKPQYEFKRLDSMEGYRAILPGRVLVEAQKELVHIPLDSGESVSMADSKWYDQSPDGSKDSRDYKSIKDVEFEPDAMYSVFYINRGVVTPWMFAVRLPV